jgi:hypothetical protein
VFPAVSATSKKQTNKIKKTLKKEKGIVHDKKTLSKNVMLVCTKSKR